MPLTTDERVRIRTHLGYGNVSAAASLTFGVPAPQQTLFLVESAMNFLLEEAVGTVRRLLGVLDNIDCKLIDAQDRLAAIQLGDLKLRDDEPTMLKREYVYWAGRLADTLRVPYYPYSERFPAYRPQMAGSIPVVH